MGNILSIKNRLKRLGYESVITDDPRLIIDAEKLILPGVGHFKQGMQNLAKNGLIYTLNKVVLEKKTPILGICLGMQLFSNYSEESQSKGFGWIEGRSKYLNISNESSRYKVPHIGWNNLNITQNNKLLDGVTEDSMFYFAHSYYVHLENNLNKLATTDYSVTFSSVVNKKNIYGVQFHPEKSHNAGTTVL